MFQSFSDCVDVRMWIGDSMIGREDSEGHIFEIEEWVCLLSTAPLLSSITELHWWALPLKIYNLRSGPTHRATSLAVSQWSQLYSSRNRVRVRAKNPDNSASIGWAFTDIDLKNSQLLKVQQSYWTKASYAEENSTKFRTYLPSLTTV